MITPISELRRLRRPAPPSLSILALALLIGWPTSTAAQGFNRYEYADYTDPEVRRKAGMKGEPTIVLQCRPKGIPFNAQPDVRAFRIRFCKFYEGVWRWHEQALDIYNCPAGSDAPFAAKIVGERYTKEPCGRVAWERTNEYFANFGYTAGARMTPPPLLDGETAENTTIRSHTEPERTATPRTPTQTGMRLPSGSPLVNCSFPGQSGCIPMSPLKARVSHDSQAYCTYGPAVGTPALFAPADDNGEALSPNTFPTGDTPRPSGGADSASGNDGNPTFIDGDSRDNDLAGTRGADDIVGGGGKDQFSFHTDWQNPDSSGSTLDDGDRIRDYESEEEIVIFGTRIARKDIKIVYDEEKGETRIELDFTDEATGKGDGKVDRTIHLDGDKRGELFIDSNCCGGGSTTIKIKLPRSQPPDQQQSLPPRSAQPQQQARPQQQSEPGGKSVPDDKSRSTPRGSGTPSGEQAASDVPAEPITVHMKATESVLAGGSAALELKAQSLKLTASHKPDLPKTVGSKPAHDTGHNRSPVTCTTGADGRCTAQIAADEREIYGFPASGGSLHYRADLTLRRTTGGVFLKSDKPPAVLTDAPNGPGTAVTKVHFKIGDKTFTRIDVQAPDEIASAVLDKYKDALGPQFETDYCSEKKPGPPLGMEPLTYSALNSELPEATVRLGRTGSAM